MRYPDTVILLFAKAPVAGQVNTRLIPDIGIEAATSLQRELIDQRLRMLTQAEHAAVQLICLPDIHHRCFTDAKRDYGVTLKSQRGNSLGDRMFNAVSSALEDYRYCILLGTDAPALDADAVGQAIEVLHAGSPVVFTPAEDGGYVLMGLGDALGFLFENITWGSEKVMQQSTDALIARGVDYTLLETCWDIDRAEDYARYLELKRQSGLS